MKKFFKGLLIAVCVAGVAAACVSCGNTDGKIQSETTTLIQSEAQTAEKPIVKSGRIYYNQLSDVEKQAYDKIFSKIYTMPDEIYIPKLDDDQLDTVFAAILKDNPDIFFTGRKVSRREIGFGLLCSIDYIFTKEEYEQRKAELDEVCDEIISSLSDPDDEWQTELEIHDYIIENCRYEIAEGEHVYSSAYGALVNGAAACEGYSKAMQLLLDRAGIENYVICGTVTDDDGVQGPHMWNIVKINGDFYHLDCTWNDPKDDESENHLYFNVNDEMISQTHSDFSYDFGCSATAENYYNKMGTSFGKYNSSHKKTMISIVAREISEGNDEVEFCFGSGNDAQKAFNALTDGDMTDYQRVSSESGVDFAKINPTNEILKHLCLIQVSWNTQTEGTDTNG